MKVVVLTYIPTIIPLSNQCVTLVAFPTQTSYDIIQEIGGELQDQYFKTEIENLHWYTVEWKTKMKKENEDQQTL